ncbi:MAG: NAD(P)H-dependent oxidoreductase [Ferruginibacter sp.]
MKNVLIIYAHPDEKSFNHAVLSSIEATVTANGHHCSVIDLYKINYNPVMTAAESKGMVSAQTKAQQQLIQEATDIVFVFPVWWFRAPAMMEGFIDKTFTPKFAYRFKPVAGVYGIPIPLLRDKKVTAFITHGAPALPVKLLYVNAVKYRFLLGFLSFCFNIFKCRIVQLWSVPFISDAKRKAALERVGKITGKRIPPVQVAAGTSAAGA